MKVIEAKFIPKIYIGGPEVFIPDPSGLFALANQLCAERGMQALCPFDPNVPLEDNTIYEHDISLLNQADAMIAHVDPFRGSEVDSGTAWEMGYMIARGKPVVAYMNDARTQNEKVQEYFEKIGARAHVSDHVHGTFPDGMRQHFHKRPLNLMLAMSSHIVNAGMRSAIVQCRFLFDDLGHTS